MVVLSIILLHTDSYDERISSEFDLYAVILFVIVTKHKNKQNLTNHNIDVDVIIICVPILKGSLLTNTLINSAGPDRLSQNPVSH